MTFGLARPGMALVALLTLAGVVLLSGCGTFGVHPPRASEAWEAWRTEYEGFKIFAGGIAPLRTGLGPD